MFVDEKMKITASENICKILLDPNTLQIRQRLCLVMTNAHVLSPRTETGENSLSKPHHAENFYIYMMEAYASGLHNASQNRSLLVGKAMLHWTSRSYLIN